MLGLILLGVVLLLLIAIIAAPWFGILRYAELIHRDEHCWLDRKRLSDAYPALKTGDIVLFAPRLSLIPVLIQTRFTHVGMVVRRPCAECSRISRQNPNYLDPNHLDNLGLDNLDFDCIDCEILLAEASGGAPTGRLAAGYHLPDGVALTPLLARLRSYPGEAYLMRLAAPLSAEAGAQIDAAACALEGRPFAPPLQLLFGVLGDKKIAHCYNLVAELLTAAGLRTGAAPLNGLGAMSVPGAICRLGLESVPLFDAAGATIRYERPAKLLYDF